MLTICGLLMFIPPVVTLFNHDITFGGVPQIVVYLFVVWVMLIIGTVLLTRNLPSDNASKSSEGDH